MLRPRCGRMLLLSRTVRHVYAFPRHPATMMTPVHSHPGSGHTFCTIEQASAVMEAVADSSFGVVDLPVILSLEVTLELKPRTRARASKLAAPLLSPKPGI
eukprot:6590010-Prymnesium_polylepis.1